MDNYHSHSHAGVCCSHTSEFHLWQEMGPVAIAIGPFHQSIQTLLAVRPATANRLVRGESYPVNPKSLAMGDVILMRPREKTFWMAPF
ncbi:MAG: hypothetical protein AAF808_12660 [Cyanobacteria bacterium P01_D01_bin.2]